MSEPIKPKKIGRPLTLPSGTKNRTIRMTDAEWEAVKSLLHGMRNRTKPKESQGK